LNRVDCVRGSGCPRKRDTGVVAKKRGVAARRVLAQGTSMSEGAEKKVYPGGYTRQEKVKINLE